MSAGMKRDPIFAAEQALRGDLSGWLHDHTEQEGECMIWQGGHNQKGLPMMNLPIAHPRRPGAKGRTTPVRRVMWEQFHHKPIPAGYQVWNKAACAHGCINPEHLLCGTHKVRWSQLAQSGKLKRDVATAAKYAAISRAGRSTLNWDIVDAIREVFNATPSNRGSRKGVGKMKIIEQLAAQYGLTVSTVMCVCYERRWAGPRPASETGAFGAMAYQLGLVR